MNTTPPFDFSAFSCQSFRFRLLGEMFQTDECDAITGLRVVASTSRNVCSPTCETSTSIPRSFIRRTTCLPKSVSPRCLDVESGSVSRAAEVAQSVLLFQVRVMYLTPRR
jgi:hypothetical protein